MGHSQLSNSIFSPFSRPLNITSRRSKTEIFNFGLTAQNLNFLANALYMRYLYLSL